MQITCEMIAYDKSQMFEIHLLPAMMCFDWVQLRLWLEVDLIQLNAIKINSAC